MGLVGEPIAGLRKGHITNSLNVPFNILVNSDGTLKSNEELVNVFRE